MQPRNSDRLTTVLNNPFYLYRREVESLPLLDKEEALALHQAIESHLKDLLWICTAVPESLDLIHSHFEKIAAGELSLDTLLHGFASLDPPQLKPDLPEVQQRLFKLLILQYDTQAKLKNLGIKSPETQVCRRQLLAGLTHFKWTAQVIDKLAEYFQTLDHRLHHFKQKFHQALTTFKQAKQALIASNLRLVIFLARKYTYLGASFLDLVQEGNIGLIQAIERFDYRWGYAFSSYASIWIKHAILNAISKFQPLPNEEVLENLEDHETPTPIDIVSVEEVCKATQQALSSLPPREANILRLRFGIGLPCSYTLEKIGQIFKVSRERIRQIEVKALKALQNQVQASGLKTFLNKD